MSEHSDDHGTEIDLTPSTNMLAAFSETSFTWKSALGELIDNAFDAAATNVEIAYGTRGDAKTFSIRDNGTGFEDLRNIAQFGGRTSRKSTSLGRYGVGAKDAALWIGSVRSVIHVTSVHGGVYRSLRIDWGAILRSGQWTIAPDSMTVRPAEAGEVGTTVRVTAPKSDFRRIPHGQDWDDFVRNIGFLYAPAIKRHRQISITRGGAPKPVEGFLTPPFEPGHVDQKIEVSGKRAHVHVGIVKEGVPNERPGITYTHGFRVIIGESGYGCGNFNYARVAGTVSLDEGWVLTKNKEDLSRHAPELYAAVFECCRELLKRSETTGIQLDSVEFERDVNSAFNDAVFGRPADTRARREHGDGKGTHEPTGTGGKHARADKTQPGATFTGATRGCLKIEYSPDESDRLGRHSPPHTIMLNTRHPLIPQIRAERNVPAIVIAACSLLSSSVLTDEAQQHLPGIQRKKGTSSKEQFENVLGRYLRGVRIDGKDVTAPAATAKKSPRATPPKDGSEQ